MRRLIQLTWQSGKAYLYAATNFEDVQEIRTPLSDGWGITNMGVEGSQLILSDGSSILTGIDPQTYQKRWSVQVSRPCICGLMALQHGADPGHYSSECLLC